MNNPVRLIDSVSEPPPLSRRSINTASTCLSLKSFSSLATSRVVLLKSVRPLRAPLMSM